MILAKSIVVLLAAAVLEVWGDSNIRDGMKGNRWQLVVLGSLMLGAYGIAVNLVPRYVPRLDFAQLLGIYIIFFAAVSACWSQFVRKEAVSLLTWAGIAVIALGAWIVQLGIKRA